MVALVMIDEDSMVTRLNYSLDIHIYIYMKCWGGEFRRARNVLSAVTERKLYR